MNQPTQESNNILLYYCRFLQGAGFILFMNKQDKLKEKVTIERKSIVENFPDYENYKVHPKGNYIYNTCFAHFHELIHI